LLLWTPKSDARATLWDCAPFIPTSYTAEDRKPIISACVCDEKLPKRIALFVQNLRGGMGKKTPSPLSKSVGGRVPVFELTPPHVASPTGGEQLWASEGKLDQLSGKRDFPPFGSR